MSLKNTTSLQLAQYAIGHAFESVMEGTDSESEVEYLTFTVQSLRIEALEFVTSWNCATDTRDNVPQTVIDGALVKLKRYFAKCV